MTGKKEVKFLHFFRRLAFPLRIFLLLLVVSTLLISALGKYLSASFEDYLTQHVRGMAMNQARIIASNDSVVDAVKHRDTRRLAQIVGKLSTGSDFDYVVIGDRHSIRLYHPNPAKIGYPMQCCYPGLLRFIFAVKCSVWNRNKSPGSYASRKRFLARCSKDLWPSIPMG